MHFTTLMLASTATLAAASPAQRLSRRTVVDYGIQDADDDGLDTRTVVDQGVQDITSDVAGDSTRNGARVFRRGNVEIIDLGTRDITDDELMALEERQTYGVEDGISSCGDEWMPVDDTKDGMGYKSAVAEFCYHLTHNMDSQDTRIAAGKKHSLLVQDGYALTNGAPAAVSFEINNKSKGLHVVNEDDCLYYLGRMTDEKHPNGNRNGCYGKKNKDTKGGTWQIGKGDVSYNGLPQHKD